MGWIELPAPSLSAQDALLAVADGERPFVLEGSGTVDADGLGRFSYAGCDPREHFVARDAPTAWPTFAAWLAAHRSDPDDACAPAIVGFATYEAGRVALDARLPALPDTLGLPLLDWAYYDAIVRRDEQSGACVVVAEDRAAGERLLARLLASGRAGRGAPGAVPPMSFSSEWSDAEYRSKVVKILDYLRAGDAYQVNLTQQLRAPLAADDALAAYLAVRRSFAAPLGGYLRSGSAAILGNSPELLLRRRGSRAESRPIKGTAPRGDDAAEIARLRASAKDAAEHVMIVDLVRHDLGTLARIGSVCVESLMHVLTLPTVHHLVSTIGADIAPTVETAALLAALLPGGSVTGAPKLRAVQIIDELEGRTRGVYCGAFGWIAPNGDCDLALPIRTAVATQGELVLGVGGGIVVDSDPERELAECRLKAAAFVRGLGGAA